MPQKAYEKEHARLIRLLSVGEKLTKEKKEQQAELKGEGVFSTLAPVAWDILKGSIRKGYPPKERQLLEQMGGYTVKYVLVRREPIQSAITSFLNALTAGQLKKVAYDTLYHLGLVLSLQAPDGRIVPVMVEKNEVVRFTVNPSTNARVESIQAATPSPPVTFAEFMEKGAKAAGDSFFTYDAFSNNCQQFVLTLLRANGIAQGVESFVNQFAEEIVKKLPSYTQGVVRGITDLGAIVNRVLEGRGLNVAKKQMSRHTEYVRGRIEEGKAAPTGKFDARGNDVWAWRSGRTYMGEMEGGARDFSSPEVGNGKPKAGKLSALTRRAASPSSSEDESEYKPIGGGSPDYDTVELMAKGARRTQGAGKPSKAKARGAMVSKLMREKGMSLGEASKYIKEKGIKF